MKYSVICSAALSALLPAAAFAANDASEIIVTATGAATNRNQVGQAVTVFDANTLEARQVQSITEVLATVPGVTISTNGALGAFAAVRIRGAEGEQTLALIDGVKVNDPASPGGGFDFGTLLSGSIDRIEVLRGPNSVPWGSEAIGGVVNIVTAAPQAGLSATARVEHGSADRTQIVGTIFGGSSRVRARLGGGWFSDDGISAYKDGAEADGLRHYAANGRIEADLADHLAIDLGGWYSHSRIAQDGFPPPFYSFSDTTDVTLSEQSIGYVGLKHQLGPWQSRLGLSMSDINRDAFAAPGDDVPLYTNKGRTERLDYRGDWRITSRLRALFGAEHERSRSFDGFSTAKTHMTSGFAQWLAQPVSQISLTAGLRVDDHATFGTHLTQSATMTWRPLRDTTLRVAYGEGFKAPTLFQLYSYYGNTGLKPETASSYDVGVEQRVADGAVRFGATLFLRNARQQIIFISCRGDQTGLCADRPDGTYNNLGQTRAKGMELTVALKPTNHVDLEAAYTLLDTEDRQTGAALPRRPRHSLSGDLSWNSPSGVRLGTSLRYVSGSLDTDFETYEPVRLKGYAVIGLRAEAPLNALVDLYGRIENLSSARVETVSGYGSYGRTVHIGARARF